MLDRQQAARFYDRFGAKQNWQRFYEGPAMHKLLAQGQFQNVQDVFEFGCGPGYLAQQLLAHYLPKPAEILRCAQNDTRGCPISGNLVYSVLSAFFLVLLLAACALPSVAGRPPETAAPAAPATAASLPTPVFTPTPLPDTGWEALRPGLERRVIRLFNEQGEQVEYLYLLRLEPAGYRFNVAYRPPASPGLAEWQAETGALIVVNGGYFREEAGQLIPTGLLISDGQATGRSYGDFAGMLAVTDGGPELRWLAQRPYDPAEPLQAALQSFPLLVKPGGELGFPEQHEDGRQARRTVIAQDRQGRLLFLVAYQGAFTLHELSRYLVESDLEVDVALNLDGGTSSGLLLAEPPEVLPALLGLPVVITVHPR